MNKEIHKIHHELLRIESQVAFLSNTLEALGDSDAKGDYDPKNPFGFAYPKATVSSMERLRWPKAS